MVTAEIQRSTQGIRDAFDDRDVSTIVGVGGLAAVGFLVAMSVGGAIAEFGPTGDMNLGRAQMVVVGLGAMATAMGGIVFLPGYIGGPLAIGAVVAVGMAFLGALVGPRSAVDQGRFRNIVRASKVDAQALSASGCVTCGNTGEPNPEGIPDGPYSDNEGIRSVGDEPVSNGFR